jgi:hypothetical protein
LIHSKKIHIRRISKEICSDEYVFVELNQKNSRYQVNDIAHRHYNYYCSFNLFCLLHSAAA